MYASKQFFAITLVAVGWNGSNTIRHWWIAIIATKIEWLTPNDYTFLVNCICTQKTSFRMISQCRVKIVKLSIQVERTEERDELQSNCTKVSTGIWLNNKTESGCPICFLILDQRGMNWGMCESIRLQRIRQNWMLNLE